MESLAEHLMVFPDATTDFSERESGKHHMTNNIALFSGKMMVGHDGLLSGLSVGRASLYQKTRHVLSLSHVVQLQVESTWHEYKEMSICHQRPLARRFSHLVVVCVGRP
jgi:hypothetical protein